MRTTMSEFEKKVVDEMIKHINAPYVWAGKGNGLWSLSGLKNFTDNTDLLCFDCCGLIEWGLWKAGRKDHRLLDNAQTEFDSWMKADPDYSISNETPLPPLAAFYGKKSDGKAPRRVDHVALILILHGRLYSLEAAGGDSTTTDIVKASLRGARVQLRPMPIRSDLLGYRYLPTP